MNARTSFLASAVLLLAMGGCATTTDNSQQAVEARIAPTPAAQLADVTGRELAHLARFDPDHLERVYPELYALALALRMPEEAALDPVAHHDGMVPAAQPIAPPPADMLEAPSLQYGVHLASYRLEDNARRGWMGLKTQHPVLAELDEARLDAVDIPGRGRYLRLKAGPFDDGRQARALCQSLEASGAYCQAVDFTGQVLTPG